MRKILILMLLPSTLLAGGFRVIKPQKPVQPPGTVERVSKRTMYAKVYQDSAHFNAGLYDQGTFAVTISPVPIHYDSAGVFREISYAAKDTTGLYDKIIRRGGGKMDIYYSTQKPGAMKVSRRKGWLEYVPAWDTTNLSVVVDINDNGWKETLVLDEKSPTRLAWGFDYTSTLEKEAKGKGRIKNILSQTIAELGEYKAWNQRNESVAVTTTYTADSLIVSIPKIMAGDTVYLDPQVNDTAYSGDSVTVWSSNTSPIDDAGWYAARYQDPLANISAYQWRSKADNVNGSVFQIWRTYFSFDLTNVGATAVSVDSARFYIAYAASTSLAAGGDSAVAIQGTWSGRFLTTSQATSFEGYNNTDSTAFNYTPLMGNLLVPYNAAGTASALFTAAGKDTLLSKMGADTLRLVILNANDALDLKDYTQLDHTILWNTTARPYIAIYYTAGNPPGVSTTDRDSLRQVQHELYGTIDSTGGLNLTVRGFESFIVGGDSSVQAVVSDTGSYTAGAFSHLSPLFLIDTSYVVRAFGINPAGSSRGAWDTLSTAISGGGASLKVDGRTVNRSW